MSTHNLCFGAKYKKNRYTPVYPSFAISKWGSRGYTCTLNGHVFVMITDVNFRPVVCQICSKTSGGT